MTELTLAFVVVYGVRFKVHSLNEILISLLNSLQFLIASLSNVASPDAGNLILVETFLNTDSLFKGYTSSLIYFST